MFMVTTVLFNKIPSAYIAGNLAGDMFQFLNYFGFGSGLFILFIQFKSVGIGFFEKLCFMGDSRHAYFNHD